MTISKESYQNTLDHLRQLSYLLDNAFAIPGTPFRVGLDAIMGLLPFGGDVLIGILGVYIVFRAAKLGLPQATLIRMVLNILIDVVVGTVPIFGDLFDATWKCHTKNVSLLEKHLNAPTQGKKADGRFIFLLLLGVAIAAIILIIFVVCLIFLLIKLIHK